jgi:oxygen-dependent protoporphyrinogen oxidase
MREHPKALVVGAGLAGLTAAHVLEKAGAEVEIFEAADRVGGRIGTIRVGEGFADIGAQFLHSNYKVTRALVSELGLESDLIPLTCPNTIFRRGRRYTMAFDAWNPPYLSPKEIGNLAVQLGRLLLPRLRVLPHAGWPRALDLDDHELGHYLRPRLDDNTYEYMVRPLMLAYAMAEPEGVSLAYFVRSAAMYFSTKTFALRSGIATLTEALARGKTVHLGAQVVRLLSDGPRRVVGIEVARGDEREEIRADAVVAAVPSPALAPLYEGWTELEKRFLDSFRYSAFPFVTLGLRRPVDDPSYAVVLDRASGYRISFLTLPQNKVPSGAPPVYVQCFLLGPLGAALIDEDDDTIVDRVRPELETVFPGISRDVDFVRVDRYRYGFPHFAPGAYRATLEFRESVRSIQGLAVAGDFIEGGIMEGAALSGMSAAMAARADLGLRR